MSHDATNWAIQQRGLKPTTKIVLWHLCDRFNPDYGCFPSQARLAHDCEIGRATLNRHLDDLETRSLIRRIRNVDMRTGQQRPTRYILGFEPGFTPPGSGGADLQDEGGDVPFDLDIPCPDLGQGSEVVKERHDNGLVQETSHTPCLDLEPGPVSHSDAIPCLKNGVSRVSNWDTNLVREPLSKSVKEEEDAAARETDFDNFFNQLLSALGIDPAGVVPGWWQGWPARQHVQRWRDDLGLSKDQILAVAQETRSNHPAPPDGPKALDRAMQRASHRSRQPGGAGLAGTMGVESVTDAAVTGPTGGRRKTRAIGPPPTTDELAAFYAARVNEDRHLPPSMISNAMCQAMLARGLVTTERLRARGVL